MSDAFDLAAMIADREAGTSGPWFFNPTGRINVRAGNAETGMKIASTTIHANPAVADRHYEFCANARRIARVPAMEAEILRLRAEVDALEGQS